MIPAGETRFGILLATQRGPGQSDNDVFRDTLTLAARAEALGLDDLWVTEHHFGDAAIGPSALALAAFLLGRTERITVGTAVTLLPLHHPIHVAEQAALLDQLSGGRFVLGVGRGQTTTEYEVIGRGIDDRRRGAAEPLDLIRAAWTGRVGASSDRYAFSPVTPTPAPLTRSGPPVYVAAGSAGTIETAAARGLPMLLSFDKNAEAKAEMVALHTEFAAAAGHPTGGFPHAFLLFAHVTESATRAHDLMADRARYLLRDAQPPASPERPHESTENHEAEPQREALIAAVTEHLLESQAVGGVDTCVRHVLRHIRASGCSRVLFQVEQVTDPDDALANLRRLATEVLPAVRAQLAIDAAEPHPGRAR
ncbi:LLM class flavin-dependent oxidoreductase [Embleya hyalina]|uniref:Alkanal monooxygenase n=1 Tax=Embleya hyalina TaxID=516124 RepID=A0A401Z669_9ACTN|nr:LLM class flavin-dependent oxidoreductase [Embleya hyalina]GCE02316.1 alkanal monooxygenase [Embleya hyalina]